METGLIAGLGYADRPKPLVQLGLFLCVSVSLCTHTGGNDSFRLVLQTCTHTCSCGSCSHWGGIQSLPVHSVTGRYAQITTLCSFIYMPVSCEWCSMWNGESESSFQICDTQVTLFCSSVNCPESMKDIPALTFRAAFSYLGRRQRRILKTWLTKCDMYQRESVCCHHGRHGHQTDVFHYNIVSVQLSLLP